MAWLGLYLRLAWWRAPQCDDTLKTWPPLSVIVCARNEADNLRRYLPEVLEQDYPDYEVLVVDDDSSDATPQLLGTLQAYYPHLRTLRISPKTTAGKKAALSQGIAAARHEWLVFTDADCWPASRQWLRHLACAMQPAQSTSPEIVLGYSPLLAGRKLQQRLARFEAAHTALQYGAMALADMPYMGVGRNLAWKKSLFTQVGGFCAHADLASGDDDLLVNAAANRYNTTLCWHPNAFVYSDAPCGWRAWFRQKQRHLSAGVQYHPIHQFILAALAGSHALHYVLLLPTALDGGAMLALGCWAIRLSIAWSVYALVAKRLRTHDLLRAFPLLDMLCGLYFAFFVPFALVLRHPSRWK